MRLQMYKARFCLLAGNVKMAKKEVGMCPWLFFPISGLLGETAAEFVAYYCSVSPLAAFLYYAAQVKAGVEVTQKAKSSKQASVEGDAVDGKPDCGALLYFRVS